MLTPIPVPTPEPAAGGDEPPHTQRLNALFRHVLHTPEGRHLWQLVLQYRRETGL